ncbi:hypothetical protein FRC02_008471 [Tulasnella sp. 418]|nr:hypothetical protein FRC02_008471 [Tulasnella sp. 418]
MTSAREAIHNLIDILLESPGTFNNLSESHEANATTLEVELDHQIKRLIKSSEAINREIDHRLKVLRQHRNQSFSPLYRLPNEIIARIFEETLIQRKRIGVDSGPFLQDLGTLSRRCRQVVTTHPTLGDTVSEDLGKKFRFRASTDTCEELKITSDHENFATFHGLHGDQHEPTTYHIKSCNIPVHFKQVLARALEGPLAPHNFSSLRSLTLCATTHRDLKPIPSICTVFLYNVPTLEKLSLVGLYAAADNVVHCLISHLNGYSENLKSSSQWHKDAREVNQKSEWNKEYSRREKKSKSEAAVAYRLNDTKSSQIKKVV